MNLKKLNQSGISHYILPLVVVVVIALIGVKVLTGTHADQASLASLTSPSCSVTGLPSSVTDGLEVTPQVAVRNPTLLPFTTTVSGATSQEVGTTGLKGAGFSSTVRVPARSTATVNVPATFAQRGYQVYVSATSSSPSFSCNGTSGPVVDQAVMNFSEANTSLAANSSVPFTLLGYQTVDVLQPGQALTYNYGLKGDITSCYLVYVEPQQSKAGSTPADASLQIASNNNTETVGLESSTTNSLEQVCVGPGSSTNPGFSVKNVSTPGAVSGPTVEVYEDIITY